MSVWLIRGREGCRFDGIRWFGRPPVLAPPAWSLAEQLWRGIGAEPAADGSPGASTPPGVSFDALRDAVPPDARCVALVVPDGTRVGPWRDILPQALRALREAGRAAARRVLLVASGAHAPLSADALRAHLFPGSETGGDALDGWEVYQNGDKGFRHHVHVGSSQAGTPVRLHPAYVGADFRALLGEISWHYFAGFGGGRKLVFPGLAEPAGIAINHRRAVRSLAASGAPPEEAVAADFGWRDGCGPGLLEGNPVHEDLEDAVALAPPQWVITAVEDPPEDPDPAAPCRFPAAIRQGPYPGAFEAAAAIYERKHRLPFTQPPAALVVDAGGHPRDATFLQAHKSLQHALRFLAPGGRLLVAAGCGEGLGSSTLVRYASEPERFRPFAGTAGDPIAVLHMQTLIALRRGVAAAEVALWSDLPEDAVRALGMTPWKSREEALAWVREAGPMWGWLPRAERFLPESGWRGGCLR